MAEDSTIWELRKAVDHALRDDAGKAFESVKEMGVDLLMAHLSSPDINKANALRLSHLFASDDPSDLLKCMMCDGKPDEAFKNHIKLVGRDGVLLDWVTQKVIESVAVSESNVQRSVFFKIGNFDLPINSEEKDHNITISLNQRLFERLLPDQIRDFLIFLHPEHFNHAEEKRLRDCFRAILYAHRYAAYVITEKLDPEILKKFTTVYPKETIDHCTVGSWNYLWWRFLGALQTACIYIRSGTKNGGEVQGFISGISVYNDAKGAPPQTISVAVFSAVLNEKDSHERVRAAIWETLGSAHEGGVASRMQTIRDYRGQKVPKEIFVADISRYGLNQQLLAEIELHDEDFSQVIPHWTQRVASWLTVLTEWLRGAIHEGLPLNFCIVLANVSQIEDSGAFYTIPFSSHDPDLGSPWNNDGSSKVTTGDSPAAFAKGMTETVLDPLRKQISKNNYSWFQDGKYALLWDATFPERIPRHLIGIKDSSWEVFVTNSRHGNTLDIGRLLLMVAYVRADGSGGVIRNGNQVLSFRKAEKWIRGFSKTGKKLGEILSGTGLTPEERARLVNGCAAVSEDPHMGGMVVIMKSDTYYWDDEKDKTPNTQQLPFRPMGRIWELKVVQELASADVSNLISLMAMDGATCIYWFVRDQKAHLAFRQLVAVPDVATTGMKELDRDCTDFLEGEGSRKWSAAQAARRPDVDMVIVISQDGPIRVFRTGIRNGKEVVTIEDPSVGAGIPPAGK